MEFNRSLLKENAKRALKNFYWLAFGVTLLWSFVSGLGNTVTQRVNAPSAQVSVQYGGEEWLESFSESMSEVTSTDFTVGVAVIFAISLCLTIFVANPLTLGVKRFFLVGREMRPDFSLIGYRFKHNYGAGVGTMLLTSLYTLLWSLLFIIPGIIKSYSYSQVPYIIAENPNISASRAIELSCNMTKGRKWDLFVLDLSFLGWYLLSMVVCCGLSSVFLTPYVEATKAEAYSFLKAEALAGGLTNESELPGVVAYVLPVAAAPAASDSDTYTVVMDTADEAAPAEETPAE